MESELKEKRKAKDGKGNKVKGNGASGKSSQGSSKNALEKSISGKSAPNKIIELGIFVDQAAMGLFMPYLGEKEYVKLRELVLAFVNAVRKWFENSELGIEKYLHLPRCKRCITSLAWASELTFQSFIWNSTQRHRLI